MGFAAWELLGQVLEDAVEDRDFVAAASPEGRELALDAFLPEPPRERLDVALVVEVGLDSPSRAIPTAAGG